MFPLQILHEVLPAPPSSQKLAILLEIYFLTWVLLILSTVAIQELQIGGVYWVTFWNVGAWIATVLALLEGARRKANGGLRPSVEQSDADLNENGRRLVTGIRYDASADDGHGTVVEVETEPTEITPLIRQRNNGHIGSASSDDEEHGWWCLQMLAEVLSPVLLISKITVLLINCQNHTLVDGNSPTLGKCRLSF